MTQPPQFPDFVLFGRTEPRAILPVVDHYAGSEKTILRALLLQQKMSSESGAALFDVTCDCEDGAKTGMEAAHATMCANLVVSAENRFGRVGIRIHDVSHPHWQADLQIALEIAGKELAFITLPKARAAANVAQQIGLLRQLEASLDLQRAIPVHVLIETHGALREVWQIATLAGVESLDFGLMDFVSDHQGAIPAAAMQSPGQFSHPLIVRAKCEVAAAAHAAGITPTHNVSTELENTDVILNDAHRARQEFAFMRMWSIHPNQIPPILAAMRPDLSEIHAAADILAEAQASGWGPIRHQGRLHDRASYRYYWNLLCLARITGIVLAEEIRQLFWHDADQK
ncbi:MAG: aldolase/citrate lyase family protein [Betaproteobacteria bacterium]|nr:aldolase/citrate lyase family protein [Betaproteobacteria bacterium]